MRIPIALLVSTIILTTGNVSAQFGLDNENNRAMMMSNLSSRPLAFTENRGQWDEKALFRAEAGGAVFFFCADEVVYLFTRDTDEIVNDGIPVGPEDVGMPNKFDHPQYKKESMVIKAQFVGANLDAKVIGEERLGYNCNYFLGNESSKWRTDVPNYSAITYKDIWQGIDLRYHGNGRGMKYDFIVNPGADISQIRIGYDGVNNLSVTPNGDLQADTRFGLIFENIPSVYQESAGNRRILSGRYRVIEPGVFGFEVDGYNPALATVIDPELIYSTYLGGSNNDTGQGVAVDGNGSVYVVGRTNSSDFPTFDPYDASFGGSWDILVSKLSASGSSLLYSTYVGGSSEEGGRAVVVDAEGSAYLTGNTNSMDFPTVNPFDASLSGIWDAFVAKISTSGNSLLYSTYLGGSGSDYGEDIAVDDAGSAFVTGYTSSSDFPMVNPYDGSFNGNYDIFAGKLSASGSSLYYCTYIGGSNWDAGASIAIDGSGAAYLTGNTGSSDFPTVSPYDGIWNGDLDAFVTALSVSGNSLIYSTFLGGSGWDAGESIAIDVSGSAYITGETYSSDFPTVDPYDGSLNGDADIFVSRLSPSGNVLVYSTYLGGSLVDVCWGISVDAAGSAYVTGYTRSSDFPTVDPYDGDLNGALDAFVTRLSTSGSNPIFSTYLGGSGDEQATDIMVDGSGSVYLIGFTTSSDFPTVNPFDESFNGNTDVFVAKFGLSSIPTLSQWGILILGLLLLAIGTTAVVRRKRTALTDSYV